MLFIVNRLFDIYTNISVKERARMVMFHSRMYFEKLLTKAILALNDHQSIEPLKMMVEQEKQSKSQFLHVVEKYVEQFFLSFVYGYDVSIPV
jgi:hypothetical protein